MKTCSRCETRKKNSEFSPYAKSSDGLCSWCKRCNADAMHDRYHSMSPAERTKFNKDRREPGNVKRCRNRWMEKYRSDPEFRKQFRLKQNAKLYGITPEEYARRIKCPCSICGRYLPRRGRGYGMHIDHDHVSGTVRGTLCHSCNMGLGRMREDPKLLRAAAEYIERYTGQV